MVLLHGNPSCFLHITTSAHIQICTVDNMADIWIFGEKHHIRGGSHTQYTLHMLGNVNWLTYWSSAVPGSMCFEKIQIHNDNLESRTVARIEFKFVWSQSHPRIQWKHRWCIGNAVREETRQSKLCKTLDLNFKTMIIYHDQEGVGKTEKGEMP